MFVRLVVLLGVIVQGAKTHNNNNKNNLFIVQTAHLTTTTHHVTHSPYQGPDFAKQQTETIIKKQQQQLPQHQPHFGVTRAVLEVVSREGLMLGSVVSGRPVSCESRGFGYAAHLGAEWRCGERKGVSVFVTVPECDHTYLFHRMFVVIDVGIDQANATIENVPCHINFKRTSETDRTEVSFISRTGRVREVQIRSETAAPLGFDIPLAKAVEISFAIANRLIKPKQIALDGLISTLSATPTTRAIHLHNNNTLELSPAAAAATTTTTTTTTTTGICTLLHNPHGLYLTNHDSVRALLGGCEDELNRIKNGLIEVDGVDAKLSGGHSGTAGVLVEMIPHVELLEQDVKTGVIGGGQTVKFQATIDQSLPVHAVTEQHLRLALRHREQLDAAERRAVSWLQEIQHREDQHKTAALVGHKLCVHSLHQETLAGKGLNKRDVGATAGTSMQAMVTDQVLSQLKEKAKTSFIGPIIKGICGVAISVISDPFKSAFNAFFGKILPLLCYFLLMLLLHILFQYGIHELPGAIQRPTGSIVVAFMAWPIILVVVLVIYHRIGLYIYRNVRRYILDDSVPQIAEPAAHQLSHSLTHSLTMSLGQTLTQSLTHTLAHSLSNSVFHFYRCSYCYHYGDQCDYCFYNRDYTWQSRMAWSGNTELRTP